MKKMKWFSALILSLVLIFALNSCCSSDDGPIIKRIENNWLVLKPGEITAESYNNPANIFISNPGHSSSGYNWYKKINNNYQLVSINFREGSSLSTNLAYEILDTIKINQKSFIGKNLYNPTVGHEQSNEKMFVAAYLNPEKGELAYRNSKLEYPEKFWGLKAVVTTSDSLLKYDVAKKSFFMTGVEPTIKTTSTLLPAEFFILMLIIAILGAIRETTAENRRLTQKKLFIWLLSFNFAYVIISTDFARNPLTFAILVVGALFFSLLSLVFQLARIDVKQSLKKVYWIGLIAIINFVEFYFLLEFPLTLSIATSLLIFSALASNLVIKFSQKIKMAFKKIK